MTEVAVSYEIVEKHVGLLTLNRPQQLNAINQAMVDQALTAFDQAEADPAVRVLVLTGAGRAFCAGGDLAWLQQAGDNRQKRLILDKADELIRRLEALTMPVIAGVNGAAAGAGTALVLACDISLASDQASFAPNFVNIGAVPDSGASWYLPRLLGRRKAMELLLTGQRLTAEQAHELGLYNTVTPVDSFRQQLMATARTLADGPQRALRSIKKLVKISSSNTLESHLEAEASLQLMAWSDPDFSEGVQAFLEHRQPDFGSENNENQQ